MKPFVILGFVIATLALAFVFQYLFTWLVVVVADQFGYTLPFWGTFGAIFIVNVLCGGYRVSCNSK